MVHAIDNAADAAVGRFVDAAVAGIGLVPLFQPIVTLCDGKTVGYEALARWPSLAHLRPTVWCLGVPRPAAASVSSTERVPLLP